MAGLIAVWLRFRCFGRADMTTERQGKLIVTYIKGERKLQTVNEPMAMLQWQADGSQFCVTLAVAEGAHAWKQYQAWRRMAR